MKKFIVLLCVGLLIGGFSAKAAKPDVIVHKSNGGYWAWLNLYNDIKYTPASVDMPAMLECTGAGFSACRVPNVGGYMDNTGANSGESLNTGVSAKITDAINKIISYSEEKGAAGVLRGSKSHTLAVRNIQTKGISYDTYSIKGSWQYNKYGEGYLYIYINKPEIIETIGCSNFYVR